MSPQGEAMAYETPEEAARGDIPERFARVVWCERSGDRAVVLLEVNTVKTPYYDITWCEQEPYGWLGGVSGNADGTERPDEWAAWLAGGERW